MGFLRSAVKDVLHPVMDAVCSSTVIYHSGVSGLTYEIPARHEQATGEAETSLGIMTEYHLHVFKVTRTNLPVVPSTLDRIEWKKPDGRKSVTEWFQVCPEPGQDHYEPQGNFRYAWKIYAKLVNTPEDES